VAEHAVVGCGDDDEGRQWRKTTASELRVAVRGEW